MLIQGTSEVTQENIGDLSDAELYELLVKYSINAGPIVGKLPVLL